MVTVLIIVVVSVFVGYCFGRIASNSPDSYVAALEATIEQHDADWEDLNERLKKAYVEIGVLHQTRSFGSSIEDRDESIRLGGKLEGINLAVDYMRGYSHDS